MRKLLLFAMAALLGCSQRVPVATVEVIDTSLSITPRAEQATMDAVRAQIGRMERGDILILIPITGDEENDAGGRLLRLRAPTRREAYDADLHRFRDNAQKQFAMWSAALGAERCRTDILGSLDAARQELASVSEDDRRRLIIVSDFLEDDNQYQFVTDQALASPKTARNLASELRESHAFAVDGTQICLGRLESVQFKYLSSSRKEAIRAFWAAYFTQDRRAPEIQLDGVGMLAGSDAACATATAGVTR